MDDDFALPALPESLAKPKLLRPAFLRISGRKRSTRSDELQDEDLLSSSLQTSSDPALFSSDETPDADDYVSGKRRKKKTYAGTWWGDRLSRSRSGSEGLHSNAGSRKGKKRKFTRNFDSGIFMNSDDGSTELSSDSSLGQELLEDQKLIQEKIPLQQTPRTPLSNLTSSSARASPQKFRPTRRMDDKHWQVISIVRHCLDQSREDVDLSGLGLESIPSEVRELSTMVKDEPAEQMHFDSLVARPRLYLANNSLREFPTTVLDVTNLRLLSLRQNKLTRLPTGIRSLTKLETLNISGNRLQSLPSEVLDLMKHDRLTDLLSDPNPWKTFEEADSNLLTDEISCFRIRPVHSHTRNGVCYKTRATRVATNITTGPLGATRSVPSLTEVVLRQLSKVNTTKRDLLPLLPEEAPVAVANALNELHRAQTDGDRRCISCRRQYVVAAKNWTEWWRVEVTKAYEDESATPGNWMLAGTHVLPFDMAICGQCFVTTPEQKMPWIMR